MNRKLGVCSWSLQPTSPADLVEKVKACGLRYVQLALDPIRDGRFDLKTTRELFQSAGIHIASGMMEMAGEDYTSLETIARTGGVIPDHTWNANLKHAEENARLAKALGISMVTFHAGVVPHSTGDPRRAVVLDRIRAIVDAFHIQQITTSLETGQEPGPVMMEALSEVARPALGINFDAANMILYGTGRPFPSLECFSYKIRQFHMKDAKVTKQPGTWGVEVPSGTGDVDWASLLERIVEMNLAGDIMIERESGTDRIADIRFARRLVEYKITNIIIQ